MSHNYQSIEALRELFAPFDGFTVGIAFLVRAGEEQEVAPPRVFLFEREDAARSLTKMLGTTYSPVFCFRPFMGRLAKGGHTHDVITWTDGRFERVRALTREEEDILLRREVRDRISPDVMRVLNGRLDDQP